MVRATKNGEMNGSPLALCLLDGFRCTPPESLDLVAAKSFYRRNEDFGMTLYQAGATDGWWILDFRQGLVGIGHFHICDRTIVIRESALGPEAQGVGLYPDVIKSVAGFFACNKVVSDVVMSDCARRSWQSAGAELRSFGEEQRYVLTLKQNCYPSGS